MCCGTLGFKEISVEKHCPTDGIGKLWFKIPHVVLWALACGSGVKLEMKNKNTVP